MEKSIATDDFFSKSNDVLEEKDDAYSNFIECFVAEIVDITDYYLELVLQPSGTKLLLGIPRSQLVNPNAVLQTEATLEDWTICYHNIVRAFETPEHNDYLEFVPPNTRIGGLYICKGNVERWQFVFYAAQSLDGSRVRCQVTLFGPNVVVNHTPFVKDAIIETCSLDSKLSDLPQICKQLEDRGVPYIIKEYK
jgi:hypothetical protein